MKNLQETQAKLPEVAGAEERDTHTVLVIDDDAQVQHFIKTLLQEEGFKVRGAADGKEALEILETEPIELILLDMNMPKMCGIEFLQRLKELEPSKRAPVIAVSSAGDPKTVSEAVRLGVSDYVLKPFHPELLKFKVTEQLFSIGFPALLEILKRLKSDERSHDLGDRYVGYPTLLEVLRLKEGEYSPEIDNDLKWLTGNQWGLYRVSLSSSTVVILLDSVSTLREIPGMTKLQARKKMMAFIEADGECECIWPIRNTTAMKAVLRSRLRVETLEREVWSKADSQP